jgi:hypothetical protein
LSNCKIDKDYISLLPSRETLRLEGLASSRSANMTMSKQSEKDRKAQRRKVFELALHDNDLIAIDQVALRGGMLDNLIDLTAEQLIQRHSPIIRKELSKFTTAN